MMYMRLMLQKWERMADLTARKNSLSISVSGV